MGMSSIIDNHTNSMDPCFAYHFSLLLLPVFFIIHYCYYKYFEFEFELFVFLSVTLIVPKLIMNKISFRIFFFDWKKNFGKKLIHQLACFRNRKKTSTTKKEKTYTFHHHHHHHRY